MAATKEKYRTFEGVFDFFTVRNLFKLSSQRYFKEDTMSPLFIGKESNVFTAMNDEGNAVVIKIYRLETCDFNRMYDYIKLDPRYQTMKKQKRRIIFAWAQREYRNLLKAREAGVSVPIVMTIMHNIIVMEMIGEKKERRAANKLKDHDPKDLKGFADDIISNMRKLYKAKLVHADLSSFNILNYREKPVLIDFSQCTTTENSRADEFLKRDIKNIVEYFKKNGFKLDNEEIRKRITA